jgi:hypothetical protein
MAVFWAGEATRDFRLDADFGVHRTTVEDALRLLGKEELLLSKARDDGA